MAASRNDVTSDEERGGWDYPELDSNSEQTDGHQKSDGPNCKNCRRVNSGKTFTGLRSKTLYKVPRKRMTCEDRNVVYLLTDREGCKYVGKTTQRLNSRMNGHRSDIYNQKSGGTRLFETHFASNELFENISVQIIDYAEDPEELAAKEKYWIEELGTCDLQKGLNSQH